VEGRERLECHQREIARAQRGFHVDPGREHTLRARVGALVDEMVENAKPEVRHPDGIGVVKRERDLEVHRGVVLDDGVALPARVLTGLGHTREHFVEQNVADRLGHGCILAFARRLVTLGVYCPHA
jgi:hypothetical protein